ncbi:MAG: hypothetical protein AAF264_11240, partial [Pseudomonadota bacterium]
MKHDISLGRIKYKSDGVQTAKRAPHDHFASTSAPRRRILMLQGPASPFWAELGRGLREAGHHVIKVHLCLPDQMFWRGGGATRYSGSASEWEGWLDHFITTERPDEIF